MYTATLGSGTVTGTLGPTPNDRQDHFRIQIPGNLAVTSISYSGPDGPHNTLGCGLTDGGAPNATFNPPQSGCVINVILSTDFMVEATPWTVTVVTEANAVVDTTPPSLSVPANQSTEATSPGGAAVAYPVATATDDTDPTPTVVCNPASNSVFAIGTTTVNCTATDDAGNVDGGSFTVTVQDTTDPTLTVPANQTAEATSPNGATVSYPAAEATDIADATPTVQCSPASNSVFAIGATTVTCTATDDAGNLASGNFTVTVLDTTGPVLGLADQQFSATGPSGAVVNYSASADDAVDATPTLDCTPAPGTTFALGATTVDCTASDDAGNESTGTFTVTVLDEGVPLLLLPPDRTVEATTPDGAMVEFEVTASDDVDPSPDVSCTPASGSTFALGTTDVSCTATDDDDNESSGGFSLTVVDTTGPVLDLPDTVDVQADRPDGAVVTFEAAADDAVAGSVPVTCSPASGTRFPIGTTTVTCTASDGAAVPVGAFGEFRRITQVAVGNETSGSFQVVVRAPAAPTTSISPTSTTPGSTASPSTEPPPTSVAALPATGGESGRTTVAAAVIVAIGALVMLAGSTLRPRRR